MKKIYIGIISAIILVIVITTCIILFIPQKPTLGIWWWDNRLDLNTYLNYAINNNITEIYYYNWKFDDSTLEFVKKCNDNKINIYLLDGDHEWLNDSTELYEKLNNLSLFINEHPDIKITGVHLDIEPHQSATWEDNRHNLIYSLINLANSLKKDFPTINFTYDIPFWFDDEIKFNNETKQAYAHMIDIADSITLMSYRDTAEDIYDVSSDEINYALSKNKTINLGIETQDVDEDIVSFYEEGKDYMNSELNKLRKLIPEDFGISIHHIRSWYDL